MQTSQPQQQTFGRGGFSGRGASLSGGEEFGNGPTAGLGRGANFGRPAAGDAGAQDTLGRGSNFGQSRGGIDSSGTDTGAPAVGAAVGGSAEVRPPPYRPPIRPTEEIFKEDQDNAKFYSQISGEDEDVTISGAAGKTTIVLDTWTDAKLNPTLYANIVEKAKYTRPRKIQAHSIPHILEGVDVKGHSETGSGKTLAFLVPIIQKITEMDRTEHSFFFKPAPIAIIIEPTRELCLQVYEQGSKLVSGLDVKVTKAYGQYATGYNLREINIGCDILCVTFGRLLHFARNGIIKLNRLKFLVLDEADNLLQGDFHTNLTDLFAVEGFPKKEQRQTMLFSATFPPEVQELANAILRDDHIFISNRNLVGANSHIAQHVLEVAADAKADVLFAMLKAELDKANAEGKKLRRTLIFVKTKRDADRIGLYLTSKGIPSTTINADRTQQLREQALRDFRSGTVSVLVATDVAARGLDIKDLDHVIVFDLPKEIVTYVHRIGRTGRIKPGDATAFYDPATDESLASDLSKLLIEGGKKPPAFLTNGGQSQAKESVSKHDAWEDAPPKAVDDWTTGVSKNDAWGDAPKAVDDWTTGVSKNNAPKAVDDWTASVSKNNAPKAADDWTAGVNKNDAWDAPKAVVASVSKQEAPKPVNYDDWNSTPSGWD